MRLARVPNFSDLGYYGFAEGVPTLMTAKGIKNSHQSRISFIVAIASPVAAVARN